MKVLVTGGAGFIGSNFARYVLERYPDYHYGLDTGKLRALGWAPEHTFETALDATVQWYVENEWWWRKIKSGDYLDYYRRNYRDREVLSR